MNIAGGAQAKSNAVGGVLVAAIRSLRKINKVLSDWESMLLGVTRNVKIILERPAFETTWTTTTSVSGPMDGQDSDDSDDDDQGARDSAGSIHSIPVGEMLAELRRTKTILEQALGDTNGEYCAVP